MKMLLKQVAIADSNSRYNGSVKDILITDGIIEKIDDNITGADFYYRIQARDLNGQSNYSPVVLLAGSSSARISVYPNPASSNMVVRVGDNNLLNTIVRLYDVTGRLVEEFRINSLEQRIDLNRVPKGVLTLRFNNGKTISIIKK
jgi:hypothetical protein